MSSIADARVAYFSMEVAIVSYIPTYSGGLGVLAGDMLRAAADLSVPMVGVTLDARTDLQAQYSYYQSNDFMDNSAVSTPYGDESREHGVTVTLNRMLSPRMRLTLKYGFYDYNDMTSGGHNNYTAHMVYSGLQYRF